MTHLTQNQLMDQAPSIFTEVPSENTSSKYRLYSTAMVIERLRTQGWYPTMATQKRVRNPENQGFQKHMVRMRLAGRDNNGLTMQVDDVIPQIVIVNSHDALSSFRLHAGLYRLVCSNGLVVADSTFSSIAVRHKGFDPDDVVDAAFEVVKTVPQIIDSVDSMKAIKLSKTDKLAFAKAAIPLRWEEKGNEKAPVEPHQLLEAKRWEDKEDDLFTTYNVIQENIIRGGVKGKTRTNRKIKTVGVNSIDENVKINKALWVLAEEMKKYKS